MLRFAIAEDMDNERDLLASFLNRYLDAHGLEGTIFPFSCGEELLKNYPPEPDGIFLDIEMDGMSGMECAHRIRAFDREVTLLFVTNMVQFALEGYEVNAADFMVKPITYESFALRMDRLMGRLERKRERFLIVKQGGRTLRLNAGEIACVESLNKKTILHKTNGETLTCTEPLYTLEKSLGSGFFRCHNAFLVNLDLIEALSTGEATVCGEKIPISKYRKKEFLAALANHRGRLL